MSSTLAVIVSVDRLRPYEVTTSGARTFVFALNLQTAMVKTMNRPGDFSRLEPWQWSPLDQEATVDLYGALANPSGGFQAPQAFLQGSQSAEIWAAPSLLQKSQHDNAVQALTFRRNLMAQWNLDAPFVWDPDNPRQDPLQPSGYYHHLIGSVSLLAGPLAYGLNLTLFVRVKASQVSSVFLTATTDLVAGMGLLASPRFTTAQVGNVKYTPSSTGPQPLDGSSIYEWPYVPSAGTDAASAYTIAAPLDLGPDDPAQAGDPTPDSFLNFHTYWVRRQLFSFNSTTLKTTYVPPIDPGSNDWHVRLADGIADAWNLPRHLLDAAAGWAAIPDADFTVLWPAILASLRDRAGMGLLPAPDGDSVVSFALNRIGMKSSKTLTVSSTVNNWLEKLRLRDRMTSLADWQQQLTSTLGESPLNLPAQPPHQPAQVVVVWTTTSVAFQNLTVLGPASGTFTLTVTNKPAQTTKTTGTLSSGISAADLTTALIGFASPNPTVTTITINGVTSYKIPLDPGVYTITATAAQGAIVTIANFVQATLQQPDPATAGGWVDVDGLTNVNLPLARVPGGQSGAFLLSGVTSVLPPGLLRGRAKDSGGSDVFTAAVSVAAAVGDALSPLARVSASLQKDDALSKLVGGLWDDASSAPLVLAPGVKSPLAFTSVKAPDVPLPTVLQWAEHGGLALDNGNGWALTAANLALAVPNASGVAIQTWLPQVVAVAAGQSGTFTLQVGAQTTAPLASNATALNVQNALENLINVGTGKVGVVSSTDQSGTTYYTIGLADQTLPPLKPGAADTAQAKLSTLVIAARTTATFNLTVGTATTPALAVGLSETALQDALENLPGAGNVASAETSTNAAGAQVYTIVFMAQGLPQIIPTSPAAGATASAATLVTVKGTTGKYTLTVGSQPTDPLSPTDPATKVQSALEKLKNVGTGKVTVASSPDASGGTIFTIVFTDKSLPQIVAAGTGGTTASVAASLTVSQSQESFTLQVGAQTTASLAINAPKGDVQKALESLSNVGSGKVSVNSSPDPPDPSVPTVYTITFTDQTLPQIVAAGTSNTTVTVATYQGRYQIVLTSVPLVTGKVPQATDFMSVSGILQGNAGQQGTYQLTLGVSASSGGAAPPPPISVKAGATSHSVRVQCTPAPNSLLVRVTGAAGSFTFSSGAQVTKTFDVATTVAPMVQAELEKFTGIGAGGVQVSAATAGTGNLKTYTLTGTNPLPSISGQASGGATIQVVGQVQMAVFYAWLTSAPPAPSDWNPVNPTLLIATDLVPSAALTLGQLANTLQATPQLQMVPTSFRSPTSTFATDLQTWDSSDPIDKGAAFWRENGQGLTAAIPLASPRRRLALGQTGRLWPLWNDLQGSEVNLRTVIEKRLTDYLSDLAAQRFGWPTSDVQLLGPYLDFNRDFPVASLTPSAGLQKAIGAQLSSFASHLIALQQLIPPDAQGQIDPTVVIPREEAADLVPTATPHAYNLQVERFSAYAETDVGADDDVMTHIAGVGVLFRQAAPLTAASAQPFNTMPWRMLNIANLTAIQSSTSENTVIGNVATEVVAPVSMTYRDGARHALVTYDNQYLIAPSPLADVAHFKKFQDQLGFTLIVGGTKGSFILTLTAPGPTPPPPLPSKQSQPLPFNVPASVTDPNAGVTASVENAVNDLLNQLSIAGTSSVTSSAGASGTTIYTIFLAVTRPGPTLSAAPKGDPGDNLTTQVADATADLITAPFRYDSVGTSVWGQLPSLKFGQMYEALPFLVGNSGALPFDLAPSHPISLATAAPMTTIPSPAANYVRRLLYLRRVGVGTPRLVSNSELTALGAAANVTSGGLPLIPAGMLPLAQELGLHVLSAALPNVRFFFDTSQRVGQLNLGDQVDDASLVNRWTLTLPRVAVTGSAYQPDTTKNADATKNANWQIRFGMWATDATGTITSHASVRVTRAAQTLTPTLDDGTASGTAATPPATTLTTLLQTVVVKGGSGTFTLTAAGATTAPLAFNAPASAVQAAFCGLAGIGANNATVGSTSSADGFTLVYSFLPAGSLANQTLPLIQATGTGGAVATVGPNTLLYNGAIDLQLQQDGTQLTLSWRRSDRDEPWMSPFAHWTVPLADITRSYVQVSIGDDLTLPIPTFGIPTVQTPSSGGDINPPPDNEPMTVLTPPVAGSDGSLSGGSLVFAIRPPAVDLQTWARWYDMDLYLKQGGATAAKRLAVWTSYHQFLPVVSPPPVSPPPPQLDLTFDDPAVSGLLFELVPLLVEPYSQVLTFTGKSGQFSLTCGGQSITFNTGTAASVVQTQLQTGFNPAIIDQNNVAVTDVSGSGAGPFVITPAGSLAGEFLNISASPADIVSIAPADPVQPLRLFCPVVFTQLVTVRGSSGSFTLSIDGASTAPIPVGSPASQVQSALEQLASLGSGNVRVTQWNPYADTTAITYGITPAGTLANQSIGSIQPDTTGNVKVTVQTGRPGLPHVQSAPFIIKVESTSRSPRLELTNDLNITIRLGEQEIWELRVFPAVEQQWFDNTNTLPGGQRFHSQFGACATPKDQPDPKTIPGDRVAFTANGTPYYLFAPWRLTIEVATQQVLLLGPDEQPFLPTTATTLLQTVVVKGGSGTFTLTAAGATTAPLAFNAPASAVQAAFCGLAGIGANNATVGSTSSADGFTLVYSFLPAGSLANQTLPLIQATGTGGAVATVGPNTTPADRVDLARALAWQAVQPSFDGRLVMVSFDKRVPALLSTPQPPPTPTSPPDLAANSVPGTPRRYRYATTIQLQRQVWRWRGRPLPPLPFEAANYVAPGPGVPMDPSQGPDQLPTASANLSADPANDLNRLVQNLQLWDAPGFGDRSGVDMLGSNTNVGYATPAATLLVEDLTSDPRALYYRFSPVFFNRYADLFPAASLFVQASGYDPFAFSTTDPNIGSVTPWRRLIVPCRWTGVVPRPVVRFIVPLTQPDDSLDITNTPGLLVVLDETAFVTGGLAETIEADVVRVDDSYNGLTPPISRPEFGPDPTLRGQGWTTPPDNKPPDLAVAMNVVGPLGHTFDTADAPLYVASSYFVRPPQITPKNNPTNDPSLAWYFIKTRFRRLLIPEGQLGYLPLPDWEPIPYKPSKPFTPVLATDRDWIISVAEITVPAATASELDLQLMLDTTAACTLTIKATPPTAASPAGTISLAIDCPPATASFQWLSPATTDANALVTLLDLRFVFQQDELTQPEGPIEIQVQGTGQFTITYNAQPATFNVGDDASTVQAKLTTLPHPANVSVTLQKETGPPVVYTYTIDVEDNTNPEVSVSASGGATAKITSAAQPMQMHFTASYRLRTPTDSVINVWQTLQSAAWQENGDKRWPTSVVATGTATEIREPRALAALVSRFTAPYWVQFLANAQSLLPPSADSYQVQWTQGRLANAPQFTLLNAQGNPATADWNLGPQSWLPAKENSDVAFVRIVLVTEVVRDVNGKLGPERYVGLYYLDAGALSNEHRSPALFDFEENYISQVTLRVLEVQTRVSSKYQFPRPDFWADVFGDPKNIDTQSAPDALSRIVGVSAPVALKVSNVLTEFYDSANRRRQHAY